MRLSYSDTPWCELLNDSCTDFLLIGENFGPVSVTGELCIRGLLSHCIISPEKPVTQDVTLFGWVVTCISLWLNLRPAKGFGVTWK